MEQDNKQSSRRKFIQQTAIAGAGMMLAEQITLFADTHTNVMNQNILAKGYAAKDVSAALAPWSFERRPVGDNDVLIEIKYSGICHSLGAKRQKNGGL